MKAEDLRSLERTERMIVRWKIEMVWTFGT